MKSIISHIIGALLIIGASVSCNSGKEQRSCTLSEESVTVAYAQGFRLSQGDGYRRVDIINPWDTTQLLRTYLLVNRNDSLPEHMPDGVVVRTPLRNALVFSSVHCSLINELQCLDAVGGVCDSEYIYIDALQHRLQNGTLVDAGNSTAPDIEKVIDLNPDAILLSPFENVRHERLEKTGIPIIECADYMENTPLGRAEWMRLMGWFFGCDAVADSLFESVEATYINTCKRVDTVESRPTVITERRTGSVWYMPGGKSYMAQLLIDAGGDYLWHDNDNTGSIALSFENVLERGQDADFWLLKYYSDNDFTYNSLAEEYAAYRRFKAFEQKRVYVCNTKYYRYYEETPFHPERLLQDFGAIFHPELFENYKPYYFLPMSHE